MTADQIARDNAHDEQTARRIELVKKVRQTKAERLLHLAQSVRGIPALLAIALIVIMIVIWRLSV